MKEGRVTPLNYTVVMSNQAEDDVTEIFRGSLQFFMLLIKM